MTNPYFVDSVVIAGSPTPTTATLTFSSAHTFVAGEVVSISGLTGSASVINGTRTISSVGALTIVVAAPSGSVAGTYTGLRGFVSYTQDREHAYARRGLTPLPEPHITGMKLLEDVSLGDLVLNRLDSNGVVWVVTDISGWWTIPESEFPDSNKAFGDGDYDVSGRYLARQLELQGSILVPDPSMASAARDTLVKAANLVYESGWLKATERQESTYAVATVTTRALSGNVATLTTSAAHGLAAGEVVKVSGVATAFNGTHIVTGTPTTTTFTYNVNDSSTVSPTSSSGSVFLGEIIKASNVRLSGQPEIENVTPRGRIDFNIGLRAADPIKYFWSTETGNYQNVTLEPLASGNDGERKIYNAGNYPVGGLITVTGPVDTSMTILNKTTGKSLVIASPLAGNDTYQVTNKQVLYGVATLTLDRPHSLSVGATVTVTGVDSDLNKPSGVVITDVPDYGANGGAFQISYPVSFASTKGLSTYTLGSATATVTAATITSVSDKKRATLTASNHGFSAGMEVTVSGMANSAYNGTFTVLSDGLTTNTFAYTVPTATATHSVTGASGSAVAAGLVTLTTTTAHGFLPGQNVVVFGVDNAINTTGSTLLTASDSTLTYYNSRTRDIGVAAYKPSTKNSATVTTVAVSGTTVTLTTSANHSFAVNEVVNISGLSGASNPVNSTHTITGTPTATTFTITVSEASPQTSQTGSATLTDLVTLYTTNPHGCVVGDLIVVDTNLGTDPSRLYDVSPGLVRFINPTANSLTYARTTFRRLITGISYTKATVKSDSNYFKVTITVGSHGFKKGDSVFLATKVKGTNKAPTGINGVRTIDGVTGTAFYYYIKPPKRTQAYLRDYFGAAESDNTNVGIDVTSSSFVTMAPASIRLTNGSVTSTKGRGPLSATSGVAVVNSIDDQPASGTVAINAETLVIDTNKRSVTLNGSFDFARARLGSVVDWLKFQPGENVISVQEGNIINPTSTVNLQFRSGWLA